MAWNFDEERPIYSQLVEKITLMITSGEYECGEKIPSVRELAANASVNPNTMQRALTELERLGLITTRRTSGKYVTEDVNMIAKVKTDVAQKQIAELIAFLKSLGFEREEIIKLIGQAAN